MSKMIYAASPQSADMLYATGFHAPDAFVFLEHRGRKTIVLNDLEIDRGRREAKVDEVLAASDLARDFGSASPGIVAAGLLHRRKIRRVDVPESEFAFNLDGRQLRYLRIQPGRDAPLQAIEFVKGNDATAPLVMAVTLELP